MAKSQCINKLKNMKKYRRLLMGVAAVMMAVMAHAYTTAEVVGSWQSKDVEVPSENPDQKIYSNYKITLDDQGSVVMVNTLKITIDLGKKILLDSYAYVDAKGTYTLNGDTLNIIIDDKSVNVNVSEDDVRVRGLIQDQVKERQLAHDVYIGLLEPMAQMLRQSKMSTTFIISELQKKKMRCIENGTTLQFKKTVK